MRSSKAFLHFNQYVMEVIIFYIVLCLGYIQTENLPPILPFIIITGGGALLISFLLSIMKSNMPYFFVLLVIPILALISSELGLSFGVSLFIAAIVCYRVVIHFKKTSKLTDSMILNLSLLIGGLSYFGASVQGYVYKDIILYLLITQLLVLMFGNTLVAIMTSHLENKEKELKKQSASLLGLFGGLLTGAIIFSIVFPFLFVKGLSFVMSVIGKGMSIISKPLFNAVEEFDTKSRPRDSGEGALNWDSALEEKGFIFSFLDELSRINIWTILSILALLILVIVTIIIAKRRFVKEPELTDDTYQFSTTTKNIEKYSSIRKRIKRQTPQVKVRKLVFELEILAASKGLGRFHYENVHEWLTRNTFLDYRLVELYERVRYGDEVLSAEEDAACDEIVKQIKSKIRTLKKTK
ncbi:hypothetical protein [Fredinandcohnia quinoae]|uniref:DUF4129 domain-containing protein n=1 Tax=Fredinandcohnia quinoae TaxID=2918902 RepID=A0AAW5E324_9BACI|nr:hypothetical protein [Fredinandcohnia sp. SECRCQ15]MCH1623980.1 hypothetical protein [Fredinandcohnia sp. SECRCQ15]